MRGRTNTDLYSGVSINATTDEFEVATGNTIVAGDFVEYHYDSQVKPLNSTFVGQNYLVDASSNLYIGLIGGFATLFTYTDGVINIVDTYSSTTPFIVRLNSTHYVLRNTINNHLVLVEVSNNEISYVAETSSSYPNTTPHRVNDTTIALIINTYLYTIITNSEYTSISQGASLSMSSASNGYFFVGATETKIVVATYTTSGQTRNYAAYIYVGNDTFTTLSYDSYFSFTTYNNYAMKFYPDIVIADRYFLATCNSRSGSGTYTYGQYIYLLDVVDKRLPISARNIFDYSDSSEIKISNVDSNNRFVLASLSNSYKNAWLFRLDESLMSFEQSEATELPSYYPNTIFNFANRKYAFMINDSGYINADTSANKVVIGTLTDTVQEWSGNGNPMGVAKQNGNAGDTIEVYIPLANT